MATRTWKEYFNTKEEANTAVDETKGTPGYSETYLQSGPTERKKVGGGVVWEVEFMEYYG